MSEKALPTELYVGAQNDILYLLDGRPCMSNDCPPHEDGPNVLAKMYGSSQWDLELCDAILAAYNGRPKLLAEVARLTTDLERLTTEQNRAIATELRRLASSMAAPADTTGLTEAAAASFAVRGFWTRVLLDRANELDPEPTPFPPARAV